MCGITGFWHPAGLQADRADPVGRAMALRIASRGPDDAGTWSDLDNGIVLAHRRLAIVDLSAAGHQPMHSPSSRYVIVFNGEIYNHAELRQRLEKEAPSFVPSAWRGHSDTETLLAAFDAWGVEETLRRAIGMFAIALWDREQRSLTLARDRIGEKPLYYGWQGSGAQKTLLFGSELKALHAHPSFRASVDRQSLVLFMRHGYVPAPRSIHDGIAKVPPGCLVVLRPGQEPQLLRYWSAVDVALRGASESRRMSDEHAVEELDTLLRSAVRQQMMADVPLGAFLSGGIDSSTIVALMQAQSSQRVKTFSIGFHEEGYNEAEHAKRVAAHLGTDHTELYVTPQEAMQVVPSLPAIYDEPFGDSSQIPTFLVSKMARQHVTVALSGDAGDELFGGYTRYLLTQKLWGRIERIPRPLRQTAAAALLGVSEATWNRLGTAAGRMAPSIQRFNRLGEKLHKGARAIAKPNANHVYLSTVSQWADPGRVVPGVTEPQTPLTGASPELDSLADVPRMMALDLMTYLPDDILVKVDRAAMGVSLETRVPMLDHRVVEFAFALPLEQKVRGDVAKWILRQVLYRYVPREMIERPKMGFGVPIDSWLRGPLRGWAEDLLDPARIRREGHLDAVQVQAAWTDHVSGRANRQYELWNVLMFQAWLAHYQSTATASALEPLARVA